MEKQPFEDVYQKNVIFQPAMLVFGGVYPMQFAQMKNTVHWMKRCVCLLYTLYTFLTLWQAGNEDSSLNSVSNCSSPTLHFSIVNAFDVTKWRGSYRHATKHSLLRPCLWVFGNLFAFTNMLSLLMYRNGVGVLSKRPKGFLQDCLA